MELSWIAFKAFVDQRNVSIQWVDIDNFYWMSAFDGPFVVTCIVFKDGNSAQTAFEATYKSVGNKSIVSTTSVQAIPPFGSKTLVVGGVIKKLYSRTVGFQQALTAGANTITYTATYNWVKLLGVEAINTEALDTVNFKVYDNGSGTYSGTPNLLLNQFAFAANMPKDFYRRMAQFDADLYVGMVIEITYNSVSDKTVGFNLIMNEVK